MPYVNIKGFEPDPETGEFVRAIYTRHVDNLAQAKMMALDEFSEEHAMWIFDDENEFVMMPILSRWNSKQRRWEDARININRAFF